MDLKELGISIVEILIASVPMLITLIATFNNKNEKIKSNIDIFTKDNKKISNDLKFIIEDKFNKIVNDNNNFNMVTIARVDKFLEDSNKTLNNYVDKIEDLNKTNEFILNINQVYMDIIVEILGEKPEYIINKSYKNIKTKSNMTKEELRKYPKLLERDYDLLKDTLKKTLGNIGHDNFKHMLGEIGYEEREEGKKL